MTDHFTITINDDDGVRQFNVHQFVKKALLYAGLFLTFIVVIAAGTILYLNHEVEQIEVKRLNVQNAYFELEVKTTSKSALMVIDGQDMYEFGPEDRVFIKKAKMGARLIHRIERDYFDVLREKLSWGK